MKKIFNALFKLGGASAVAVGTSVLVVNVVDNLLVKRKWTMPKALSDAIAGADMSEFDKVKEKNMTAFCSNSFENHAIISDKGKKLTGYFVKAKEPSNVFVFLSHGYRSQGKDEFCVIAQYYLKKGFNVFLVDHVASGESEGDYVTFGAQEHKDCIKWLEYLNETFGKDIQIILHGVSMGAATVMLMSGDEKLPENVKMIVSDCGYTSAWDEFDYKLTDLGVPHKALLKAVNGVNKKKAGFDFKEDTNALESVKRAKVPMLFVHGSADTFVPTYMVNQVYSACASENKDYIIIEGADHAQSFIANAEKYEAKLDEFVEKFVCDEKEKVE